MNNLTKAALIGVLAALAGAQAWAATPIASCPFSITAPGNYIVTADLTCSTGDGITITASNVSLNLNGHIITGPGAATATGIHVGTVTTRLNHVGISGPGLIRKFTIGIWIEETDLGQVSLVTVAGNGFGIMAFEVSQLTVGGNTIAQNSNTFGLALLDSMGAQVTGNKVVGNNQGITLVAGSANVFSGNTVSGNLTLGIAIAGTSSRVSSNTTDGNGEAGIWVQGGSTGNQIFSNTSSVGNRAFDLEDDNLGCGTNFWSGNVFFTKSQPCVK